MAETDPNNAEHQEVVLAVLDGDPEAWSRLVGIWSRRVYAAARSRLHDPEAAEEVTQSVMVTVYEHISKGKYSHTGQFESWLFRIAMNRVRDVVRRQTRRREVGLSTLPPPVAPLPERRDAASGRLRDAIASLTEADQEVISLRHHAQLSFGAIAEMLAQPVGTVLARHHRAVNKLKSVLESDHTNAGGAA